MESDITEIDIMETCKTETHITKFVVTGHDISESDVINSDPLEHIVAKLSQNYIFDILSHKLTSHQMLFNFTNSQIGLDACYLCH